MAIKDSGARRQFYTPDGREAGVRDVAEGKGRCDLLPLIEVSDVTGDRVLHDIGEFMKTGETHYIYTAIVRFVDAEFPDFPTAVLEYAVHMEEGCGKYGDRNWEKGIPCHCYVDSGVRHLLKCRRGDTDERHDRAFLWNMFGLLWTLENRPELNDLPKYEVQGREEVDPACMCATSAEPDSTHPLF